MKPRYLEIAAALLSVVLIVHAVLAFVKHRWVTGSLELLTAAVLLWQWWLGRSASVLPPVS